MYHYRGYFVPGKKLVAEHRLRSDAGKGPNKIDAQKDLVGTSVVR